MGPNIVETKILLVNPPPYKILESYYDMPPYPRTGLACLAAYLRKHEIAVEIIDCKLDRLDYGQAADMIISKKPSLVGFTAFTNEIIQSAKLAAIIKERAKIWTIIGGVHASILPEKTLREFASFDYACIGEGEITLLEIVKALQGREPDTASRQLQDSIPGIAYLDDQGSYIYHGDRDKIKELDLLPMPAWDLFRPCKEYILHTQRGCPYHCPFCVNPNGRIVRKESPATVINELNNIIINYGCRSIGFGDEIFTVDRERTIEICMMMIKAGIHKKIQWTCTTHINCIDTELATIMRKAGCRWVGLGIESGNSETLRNIGKSTSINKIESVVAQLKKAKLPFASFFILGQPNETYQSAKDTIDFAVKLNPDLPIFGIMVPYPGTKIGAMAAAGDGGYHLSSTSWNDYNKQIGDAVEFRGISRVELEKMQIWGYVSVFLKNYRFIDFMKFCWQYKLVGWNVFKKILCRNSKR